MTDKKNNVWKHKIKVRKNKLRANKKNRKEQLKWKKQKNI